MECLKQSTAATIILGPFHDKTDGVTPEIGLATAMDSATTGIRLNKNGALDIDRSSATSPIHDIYGDYTVTLDATDTNTLGRLRVKFADSAVNTPAWKDFMIMPANVWDSLFGADKLQVDLKEFNSVVVVGDGSATIFGV